MTFGWDVDFNSLNPDLVKGGVDLVYVSVFFILWGLIARVSSGKTPFWYPYLEQMLGVGFVITAVALIFVLPVTVEAAKIYFAFYFFQILLFYVLPGKYYEGLPVKEEGMVCRKYKCNGLLAFIVTLSLFFYGAYSKWWSITIIYDNFAALLNVVNIWSIFLSLVLYLKGKFAPTIQSKSEDNWAYDIWYGLELNPEIFGFDIKFWSESRPGLIWWALINISVAGSQYQQYGFVSTPLLLVAAFQFLYVLDYFVAEPNIVSTWDIAFEKFGFMLVWGDYLWVPFFYSIQSLLLRSDPHGPAEISTLHTAICIITFIAGYTIFRGSNRQKHLFKTWIKNGRKQGMPMGGGYFFNAQPEVRGRYLLVSGWWGLARHMNYLGDLLISLAWSLPCGLIFGIYPYTHLMFMTGLLLHRFARDDEACAKKYGADWDEYCEAVPYKLIPGIF